MTYVRKTKTKIVKSFVDVRCTRSTQFFDADSKNKFLLQKLRNSLLRSVYTTCYFQLLGRRNYVCLMRCYVTQFVNTYSWDMYDERMKPAVRQNRVIFHLPFYPTQKNDSTSRKMTITSRFHRANGWHKRSPTCEIGSSPGGRLHS